MAADDEHPDLALEQAHVDRAYRLLGRMVADVRRLENPGGDVAADFEVWRQVRIAALSDTRSALVFGRIDRAEGETYHVGRQHVRDDEFRPVVVDWRAPVSKAFYQAGPVDPMGVRLRRRFLVEGREILGIADDHPQSGSATDPRADEILQRELSRPRTGEMRDVVATIHAEQDAIIRAPLPGIVVVQGGPGTGKTVIGLHRAAFLLYEHREHLERRRVLVLGPNRVFMDYVSQVLPSLGEWALVQVAVDDLAPTVTVSGVDAPEAARVKGDARMADVLRRALDHHWGAAHDDLELDVRGVRFSLPRHVVQAEADLIRSRPAPWREGRTLLRDELLATAYAGYVDRLDASSAAESFRDAAKAIRADRRFIRTVDTLWPSMTSTRLVGGLLSNPGRLARAADGLLSAAEQRAVLRRRAAAWTAADRALLDHADTLIDGAPLRYGHVVLDEAQDLSPMQLRMIAARCPHGSMTVLGDLGQATGAWAHGAWTDVLRHLPAADGARVDEITVGYRVSRAVMRAASGVLRAAAPSLRAPTAVRRDPGEVSVVPVEAFERASAVVGAATAMVAHVGGAAVIVPSLLLDETREALEAAGCAFGEAESQGLRQPLTLVRLSRCKGLEFEGVVVSEPARIVDEGGLRFLYVAMTRAMRTLTIVHAEPLPDALAAAV